MSSTSLESLPFFGMDNVKDYIECKPDITKVDSLKPLVVNVKSDLKFTDRLLTSNRL